MRTIDFDYFPANDIDSVGFLRPVDHLLFHPEWRCDRCETTLSASEADEAERAANEMWNSKVREDVRTGNVVMSTRGH